MGLLLAAVVDNATHRRQDTGCYRIPIAVQFAWALVLVVGMLLLLETPRYLIRRSQPEKAAAALGRLRRLPPAHPAISAELAEITASYEHELSLGASASILDCFRTPVRKRQLTGMALSALQQATGVNFIFYYGTQYFTNSGLSNAFAVQMITSGINVLSTVPGLWAIERWGRRPLLLGGAVGMCVSQLLVALLGTLTTGQDAHGGIVVLDLAAQKASIAFVCVFIVFFASTWGPLAWVVTGEIFPLQHRARALAITTATNVSLAALPHLLCLFFVLFFLPIPLLTIQWLINWAIAYSTPYLVNYGPGCANLQSKIFFVWFGACLLCIAFVYFFIYETKGLSLEEIDQMYTSGVTTHHSRSWKPTPADEAPVQAVVVIGQAKTGDDKIDGSKTSDVSSSGDDIELSAVAPARPMSATVASVASSSSQEI